MPRKINHSSVTTAPGAEVQPLEISGDRKKDLQAYRQRKSVDFGICLLEYYVPQNKRLIAYCKQYRDAKYIAENLNAILNGNN